jgi:hypothetical protein
MTRLSGIVPKLIVFVICMVLGGTVAYVGVSALNKSVPVSAATEQPEFAGDTPGAEGGPSAWDLTRSPETASTVKALPPADLDAIAADLLDNEPVKPLDPSGFPRVSPITQFDGGPFQNANCTLASGAMLARLGWGIVTTGSTLRSLQNDQDGGTGLDDLKTALWKGYGVVPKTGLLKPSQLKDLLAKGYGAVIQGVYSFIPEGLSLQPSFDGPHAIYVDAYWPGDGKTPPAYYVIDPIGRPQWGYEGDWWPASVVDSFGTAFTTAMGDGPKVASAELAAAAPEGRIAAAWVFPPGGVPPEITDPDVLPIPASGGQKAPGGTPEPPGSAAPGASGSPAPGASGSPAPSGPPEAGDGGPITPELQPLDPVVTVDDVVLIPWLLVCIIQPIPPGCPEGEEGVFDPPPDIILKPPPAGTPITVTFVDSDRPDVALIGYRYAAPELTDVRFWKASESETTAQTASAIGAFEIGGQPTFVAHVDTEAATAYHFQVVAGDDGTGAVSPVGTFTTAAGLKLYDVNLDTAANPNWSLGEGISPYLHLGPNGFAPPLLPDDGICPDVSFGTETFCLIPDPIDTPEQDECSTVKVDYELTGIEGTGVKVKALPTTKGVLDDRTISFRAAIEGEGPPGDGSIELGCLTPGLTYNVAVDVVGDAGGAIGVEEVTAPEL